MPSDTASFAEITDARRRSIAATIRTISTEEVKALGEGLFPYLDHPWREKFFDFLDTHADAIYHHALTDDGYHILYCQSQNRGIWFTPGSGVGPLQEKGLAALAEILAEK